MNGRPDIATVLGEGEILLWQGHPKKGRPVPRRARRIAAGLGLAALALMLGAIGIELFRGHLPGWRLVVYGLISSAAFLTFVALRLTLLDTRRARARDARTAYGITDRRAFTLSGPYKAELPLSPDMRAEIAGERLTIANGPDSLRFDRLDDAPAARDILIRHIGGHA